MTDPIVAEGDGHTPLANEELDGLIPSYVSTRGELNEAEQANIVEALGRLRVPSVQTLLDDKYLRDLHRAMFGRVWTWAGHYRVRELNIGIDPARVAVAVRDLVANAAVWIDDGAYATDESAARFHHRIVEIHPFPNGNGRLARVATNLLLAGRGAEPFTWGAGLDVTTAQLRTRYIAALRAADAGDIDPLLRFVRM